MLRVSPATWFAVHRWIGLNCGAVLFVICLSGTIATFSHELDRWIDPRLCVDGVGPPLSIAEIADRVSDAHPEWRVVSISAAEPGTACTLEVERTDGRQLRYLVHPWTADIRGPTSNHRVRMLFRVFHKQFYIFPGQLFHGTWIVGLYGFALGLAGVTGLACYTRFWAKLFRMPRRDHFWRETHRLLGVWSAALLFLWSLTGIWYFTQRFRPTHEPSAGIESRGLTPIRQLPGEPLRSKPAAELIAVLARLRPDVVPLHLTLPQRPGGPLIVLGRARSPFSGSSTHRVEIDSREGSLISATPARSRSAAEFLDRHADPLHFGTFGGLISKSLWFVFGLAVTGMMPLGAVIWLRRLSRNHPTPPPGAVRPADRRPLTRWASTLGTVSMMGLAIAFTWHNLPASTVTVPSLTPRISLGTHRIGSRNVAFEQFPASAGKSLVRVLFPRADFPDFVTAELRQARTAETGTPAQPLTGSAHFLHAVVPVVPGQRVELVLRDREGREQSCTFQMANRPVPSASSEPPEVYEAPQAVRILFWSFALVSATVVILWLYRIG